MNHHKNTPETDQIAPMLPRSMRTEEPGAHETSAKSAEMPGCDAYEPKERARTTAPPQPLVAILAKYFGVSGTQTIVELGAFALLNFLGLPHSLANGTAIVLSASTNFLLNRNVTFKSSGNIVRSIILFVLLWVWNYLFSTTALSLAPSAFGIDEVFVKMATMALQACWGFPLLRFVIFR